MSIGSRVAIPGTPYPHRGTVVALLHGGGVKIRWDSVRSPGWHSGARRERCLFSYTKERAAALELVTPVVEAALEGGT